MHYRLGNICIFEYERSHWVAKEITDESPVGRSEMSIMYLLALLGFLEAEVKKIDDTQSIICYELLLPNLRSAIVDLKSLRESALAKIV